MREQRKARRFDLRLPFELVRSGALHLGETGETKNISSMGVLIDSEALIDPGEPVEYIITLPTLQGGIPVQLRCLGKVVRRSESELAATLERYEFIRMAAVA